MRKKLKSAGALVVLLAVMGASYGYRQWEMGSSSPLQLPVARVEGEAVVTTAGAMDAIESYRQRRSTQREKDIGALSDMIASPHTTQEARADAEHTMNQLAREGEMEMAMEGAMTGAGFSPCLCVVEGENVTLMVGKKTLTQGEASLLMTMAQSHTGRDGTKIMILTGGGL